jgi:hypothetical protein
MPGDKRAYSVTVLLCSSPDCGQPHILLCRENGEAFAEAVLSDGTIMALLAARLRGVYEEPPDDAKIVGH